jgi:type I restriction enzyme M protein
VPNAEVKGMNHITHNSIISFIWRIADEVLRDVYARGKYRDVILPMTVLRRLDILLEHSKEDVLKSKQFLDELNHPLDKALRSASGYPFYNTSPFTMKGLLVSRSKIQKNFESYLAGFSENVLTIIEKFKFRNQIETLVESNRLYLLIQKFTSKDINLGPEPIKDEDGTVIQEGLTNLGMGYVFEELIRRFNEENNEEAGEHFTPRDIIKLMTNLIILPIKDQIQNGRNYQVYDPACGSGGMLTEAESLLQNLAGEADEENIEIELFGQEVNPETFAICQSDILIKGRDPANIKYGSTLSSDDFPGMKFDFMLANPPYGKSWKGDLDILMKGGRKAVSDPRYMVYHPGLPPGQKLNLLPRVSDGQLLFLVNMLHRMKYNTKLGSRIAIVHNGSAIFTGDAGQGESNIRQWIIENDWLECIIGLPEDMFYNTGIATYIWVLTNQKPKHRKGKIQLIDATHFYKKLRKNLGKKNCELKDEDIQTITDLFLEFSEGSESKIFDNEDFGYRKITVERPLRLTTQITHERLAAFKEAVDSRLYPLADALQVLFGNELHEDFNTVRATIEAYVKKHFISWKVGDLKFFIEVFAEKDETAEKVIKKQTKTEIIYEPDPDLRDTEKVPLKESVEVFFAREVLPNVPDAWIDHEKTVKGYEISFTKYFYQYKPLRSLDEITADILALESETEGVLAKIIRSGEVVQ